MPQSVYIRLSLGWTISEKRHHCYALELRADLRLANEEPSSIQERLGELLDRAKSRTFVMRRSPMLIMFVVLLMGVVIGVG